MERMRRNTSKRGLFFLSLLFLGTTSLQVVSRKPGKEIPTTWIPHLVKSVQNKETAPHLSHLAEFAVKLLQWSDTDRQSVIAALRMVKGETYAQQWGKSLDYSPLSLSGVIDLMSEGYWSLESPRLTRIQVGEEISVLQKPDRVDLLRSVPTPLPFVLKNLRKAEITVRVGRNWGGGTSTSIELRAGQAFGIFLDLSAEEVEEDGIGVVVEVEPLRKMIPMPVRLWEPASLRVRLLDERGLSAPARVYLTGPDGRAYVPDGVLPRVTNGDYGQPFGGDYFFYTGGEFEVELPAGQALLEAVKGIEYTPVTKKVQISPGQTNRLEIELEKPFDMDRRGWYSGDVHMHPNSLEDRLIEPNDVLLIAKAEDLDVCHLLTTNSDTAVINDRDRFEGKPHALSDEDLILYWNEEVRNLRLYGHIGLLGLKEFVDPAYTGWPRTPYPYDYPPNYNQALAAKKQGAAVTYVHPSLPSEYPVDIALGAADTIDVMCQGDEERNTADWYRLLNCGFKCPISAGTDSALNIPYHLIAGAGRVYVQMEPKLSYEGWIEGYKQGRSFATNAPLLHFSVNEKGPGEEIHWQSGSLELKVRAEATSHVPMERMDLVVNGRVMASQKAEREGTLIRMRESLTIADSSWVAVRVRGKAHKLLPNDKALYAHSSPLYCYRSKRGIRFREDALYFIEQIDRLIQKVEDKGLFEDSAEKQKVIDLFRKGQTVYQRIAAEATQR